MKDIENIKIVPLPDYIFGYAPKVEEKDGGVHICPQCKGKAIKEETAEGFKVCGVCKGERTVECVDQSYHYERNSVLGLICGNRNYMDVVRIVAKDRPRDGKKERDFEKVAHYSKTRWLGYTMPLVHIVQNDINGSGRML